MNLKKEVFAFSKWGKLISALETFVVLFAISMALVYGLSLITDDTKGPQHMFRAMAVVMAAVCLFMSFSLTFHVKTSTSWFLWRILPMNRKVAIRYLKDRQQKLEKKLADSDDYLKQLSDGYHEAIVDHAKGLEEAKKEIEELKNFLAIYK